LSIKVVILFSTGVVLLAHLTLCHH
jgi:hypothetical protein